MYLFSWKEAKVKYLVPSFIQKCKAEEEKCNENKIYICIYFLIPVYFFVNGGWVSVSRGIKT